MKIELDLNRAGLEYTEFHSKEAWDDFMYQFRPNRGFYNPQPRDMRPARFPCAMLSEPTCITYCAGGNDEYWNTFIYPGDYSITED